MYSPFGKRNKNQTRGFYFATEDWFKTADQAFWLGLQFGPDRIPFREKETLEEYKNRYTNSHSGWELDYHEKKNQPLRGFTCESGDCHETADHAFWLGLELSIPPREKETLEEYKNRYTNSHSGWELDSL